MKYLPRLTASSEHNCHVSFIAAMMSSLINSRSYQALRVATLSREVNADALQMLEQDYAAGPVAGAVSELPDDEVIAAGADATLHSELHLRCAWRCKKSKNTFFLRLPPGLDIGDPALHQKSVSALIRRTHASPITATLVARDTLRFGPNVSRERTNSLDNSADLSMHKAMVRLLHDDIAKAQLSWRNLLDKNTGADAGSTDRHVRDGAERHVDISP